LTRFSLIGERGRVMNADGSDPINLTNNPADSWADWSPAVE